MVAPFDKSNIEMFWSENIFNQFQETLKFQKSISRKKLNGRISFEFPHCNCDIFLTFDQGDGYFALQ